MICCSPIIHIVARFAMPLTFLASIVIFFQGHNLPGGGFIAGIMLTAALAIHMLAFGIGWAANFPWWRLSILGLLCAILTGTVPFLYGLPFMHHSVWFFG